MTDPISATTLSLIASALKLGQSAWDTLKSRQGARAQSDPGEQFRVVRELQRRQRRSYSELAYFLPRHATGRGAFQHAPLLAKAEWIPSAPIELAIPNARLSDDGRLLETSFEDGPKSAELCKTLAASLEGMQMMTKPGSQKAGNDLRLHSLSDAIARIENPNPEKFVSNPSYALRHIEPGVPYRLRFASATYFDYIDCGELLAYETILQSIRGQIDPVEYPGATYFQKLEPLLSFRAGCGDWDALAHRPSLAGVSVLTVFTCAREGAAYFPMMLRSTEMGSGANTHHVIPAGEFQPTSASLTAWKDNCTLWQTVLREFSEEILLDAEAKSQDMDMLRLSRRDEIVPLVTMIRERNWRTYFMGIGLDALTLKPEVLLLSTIDLDCFKNSIRKTHGFTSLPTRNSEGKIVSCESGWGEMLGRTSLCTYRDHPHTLPAGAGCIELFQRHLDKIPELSGLCAP